MHKQTLSVSNSVLRTRTCLPFVVQHGTTTASHLLPTTFTSHSCIGVKSNAKKMPNLAPALRHSSHCVLCEPLLVVPV